MIPDHWRRHHRGDGELIGYLAPDEGDDVVPMTLLGTVAGEPTDEWSAGQVLDDLGLSYLADRWVLVHEDGSEQRVVLVEVGPDRVVVANADFAQVVGAPRDIGEQIVLDVPTDRLRRA